MSSSSAVGLAAVLLSACTVPATEVRVMLATDAPTSRALSIVATVRAGTAASGVAPPVATFAGTRGGPDGGLVLPADFAIVPGRGSNDGVVTLVVEASLAPAGATMPMVSFRRLARFSFSPHVSTMVPMFLAVECGNAATGCATPGVPCTVAQRCEEAGATCAERGACTPIDVVPVPTDAGAPDALDVPLGSDIPVVADVADAAPALTPPRPIAPLSSAMVTSHRPSFRWQLAPGTDGAVVEVCSDRACAHVAQRLTAMGASTTASADLPPGVWFWRLRATRGASVGTDASATWQFVVGASNATVVTSWGSVADFDGDGAPDVAIGADAAVGQAGRVYIYHPDAHGSLVQFGAVIDAPDGALGAFGDALASVDVNGDGYADLVVGAPYVATRSGRVYVYSGGPRGLSTTPAVALATLDAGEQWFGAAVAGAGDVNGDGYGDVAIGVPFSNGQTGAAFVYYGGPMGLAGVPVVISGPDGVGGAFGASIAGADVDGDGFGDVAVGAAGAHGTGRVYVYRGGAAGIRACPLIEGDEAGGQFGSQLTLGDVDANGYADLIAGAPVDAMSTGRVFVYSGGSAGVATTPATTLLGPGGPSSRFGDWIAARDLGGDGFADLVIGAPSENAQQGTAYLFDGSATGVVPTVITSVAGPEGPGGVFGKWVAVPGDVDGDGFNDVLVAAPGALSSTGNVYLFNGGTMVPPTGPPVLQTLAGPDGVSGEFGHGLAR